MSLEHFFTPYEAHQQLPGRRVLVLAPHPDDEVFGCGGTLAKMVKAGADVQVLVLTDGVLASEWSELTPEEAARKKQQKAQTRRDESIAAAASLGYKSPAFLGWADGELLCDDSEPGRDANERHLAELKQRIENFQPDLILAPSVWEMHRDHRAVAQWALALMSTDQEQKSASLAFYEVGVPLQPNYLIDITDVQEQKLQAMQCFPSQLEAQAYSTQMQALNVFRSYTLGLAVKSAEAFHIVHPENVAAFTSRHQPDACSLVLLQAERELALAHDEKEQTQQQVQQLTQQLIAAQRRWVDFQRSRTGQLVQILHRVLRRIRGL